MPMSRLEINVTSDMIRKTSSSSKGNQIKWFNGTHWIKENSMGYEDLAEWVSSKILSFSNLESNSYINYDLCKVRYEDGTSNDGCVSENFIPKLTALITLHRLFEKINIDFSIFEKNNHSVDYRIKYTIENIYNSIGLDITSYLSALITLDAFILNEDRHFNNIAFLVKNGEFYPCPIFDNGLSLLSDIRDYPLDTPSDISMRRVKSRTFSSSFSKQLEVLGVGFQIDGSKLDNFLETYKSDLGRIYGVLKRQMVKYKGTIVV